MGKIKTLKISEETHKALSELGSVGQTYEDVIKMLIREHESRD